MADIDVSGSAIRGLPRAEIARFARLCLRRLGASGAIARPVDDVSIVFVGDDVMRSLNRRFRKKKKTTDVLTFHDLDVDADIAGHSLGEIVICVDQAGRQAKEQHHSLATEVRYLILHGLIHALGFDHMTDHGEMNALEMSVRTKVGLE